nr:unnamed protein product [Callosobruchus chinensis]
MWKVAPLCLPVHIQLSVPADATMFQSNFLLHMHTGLPTKTLSLCPEPSYITTEQLSFEECY